VFFKFEVYQVKDGGKGQMIVMGGTRMARCVGKIALQYWVKNL
jgi:hypothetical protein